MTSQFNTLRFDIFRVETRGSVLWLEAAPTVERAKERVKEFAQSAPGEYIVMNQTTGEKLFINPNALDSDPRWYNVRYPSWERAYLDALREQDSEKLFNKVIAAESAIVRRLHELRSPDGNSISNSDETEGLALTEASDALLTIKIGKLKFPGWKPPQEACS